MLSFDACLLQSFGSLQFGSSSDEVVKVFGAAEESEELEAIDGSKSAVWHYWSKGFSLFFDGKMKNRFCCAEIDSSVQLKMWDIPIFSLNEPQLKELFVQNGFKELDEELHEWGEKRITFEDAMADFYFEKGVMVSVNYGTAISSEMETNN
ncbi:MAG: hypothetical protein NT084_12800 [Bacteroidetes bacterium]|jgi:hypothetical protein|nr:hypothetical protein [Bacteroidota bacterium]